MVFIISPSPHHLKINFGNLGGRHRRSSLENRARGRAEGAARGKEIFLLHTISHFTYEMVEYPRVKLPWMAISGSVDRMSVASDPVGFITLPHFISEMTDCMLQKNLLSPCRPPCPSPGPVLQRAAPMPSAKIAKIDFPPSCIFFPFIIKLHLQNSINIYNIGGIYYG